jgi:hypothetical protein
MFRGGKVIDSRGTGITSGLMDGGRVGYQTGDLVLGRDLYSPKDFSNFMIGYKDQIPPALKQQVYNKDGTIKEDFTYENIFEQEDKEGKPQSVFDSDIFKFSDVGIEGSKSKRITSPGKKDFANALKTDVLGKMEESGAYSYDDMPRGGGADAATFGEKTDSKTDDPNDTDPTNTEISPEDLIRENAELFKELLGEASKEDIKKARIGDASDYLLKFFEGTQKEGATLGSAAADVAGFATSRDSRTDKAREAKKKTEQTATALAINDYIAGKRSKEDIVKALSLAKAKVGLTEGSTADKILAAGKNRTITGTMIKNILGREVADGKAKGTKTIPTGQEDNYKPGPEDEGFYIFEEGTKNVFLYSGGVKIPVFVPGG